MANIKMVVVNGIRYRPEDAPDRGEPEAKAKAPANKARQPRNKSTK